MVVAEARAFLLFQFSSLSYGNSGCCIDINRFAIATSDLSASLISKRERERERERAQWKLTTHEVTLNFMAEISRFSLFFYSHLCSCHINYITLCFDRIVIEFTMLHVTCKLIFATIYFLFREILTTSDLMSQFVTASNSFTVSLKCH